MIAKLQQYIFVAVLVMTGSVMISSSIYSINIIHDVADIHAPLIDAAMEIKLEMAEARSSFMEHIHGDKSITLNEVSSHLDQAQWYAHAMLLGDQNNEAVYLPLDDEILRHKITVTLEDLTHLRRLILTHHPDFENVVSDSMIIKKTHQLFKRTIDETNSVDVILLATLAEQRALQRTINYSGLILSIILFIIVVAYFIYHRRLELALMDELNEIATYDALTGIPNRRSFDATVTDEWNHTLRAQSPLSIVLCDIDCFKKYNDALGHQAGDECLRDVAQVMRSILQRPIDSVARYGGEEFVYIFPFTDIKGAENMINLLHDRLAAKKIAHPDSEVSNYVTLSAGIASLTPTSKHSIRELIAAADDALYRAKDEGRNRTCLTPYS